MDYQFYLAGSLEKVFPTKMPLLLQKEAKISILKGEIPAVQLVYRREVGTEVKKFILEVEGFPAELRLRNVELVPSAFPCSDRIDDNYLTTEPGLFPDLLVDNKEAEVIPLARQYRSVWIDFPKTMMVDAGEYTVSVKVIEDKTREMVQCLEYVIEVSDAVLPEQTLIHTEWFHTDCIADYYQVEVFSEAHWDLVEKQIAMAADLGINMLLTPVFTPPLDTAVGGERTTVQLVDVTYVDGNWSFDFEKLDRWCGLCKKYGIKYLEIAHLFTQWGAKATPKIIVSTETGTEKMFGWHVSAEHPSYRKFLEKFLPALQEKLIELGYGKEEVIFHVSDEPRMSTVDSYQAAKTVVADLLEGWKIFDALSDYDFYANGIIQNPIPSNNHIQEFFDHGVKDLWTYYCCSQTVDVPNRFFAMPSARNRIMGVLMYLYDIKGFLQWGFNFYNASLSRFHLDPFFDTHANYAFPSGDSFLVYPGPEGKPLSSIRGEVQRQAFADMRALQYLESKIGREAVVELIHEEYEENMFTFSQYPKEASYFYELRRKIARKLK